MKQRSCFSKATIYIVALIVFLPASVAYAHVGAPFEHAYYDVLYGMEVTLGVGSVLLLMAATGLLIANRKTVYLVLPIPVLFIGAILGATLGALAWLPADMPAYIATISIGLLVAASPTLKKWQLMALVSLAAATMANVMFMGSDWRLIPISVYMGVVIVLLLGTMTIYMSVWLSRELLQYPWVDIAWRAIASWLVAIAVIMIALSVTGNT
ncbi:MAG: hypothetical protein AAGA53_12855 [Pseudomonadota bacterium]